MNILIWSIIILYLLTFVLSLLVIPLGKIYEKKLSKVKTSKYKDIYVLLPALKEQKIVDETINWFRSIEYKGNIRYVVITSEKEEKFYKDNNINEITTNQLVEKKLVEIKDKRFIHYHYPETNGNKSSQLNYAVEQIIKNKVDMNNTYVSVFDFDSKPDVNTFNSLSKVAEYKNNPDVIGQVPMCFKNYVKFSKNPRKILVLLYAFQQTIRATAIEKLKLILSSFTNLNIPQYCMGACMHIKLKTLVDNDMFPIFVDDLTLGYRLSIKNCKFAYLPSSNYVLIPNKIFDYVNSSVLIFKGVTTYLTEIKRAKKRNLWGKIKLFVEGTGNLIVFIMIPVIFLIFYLYSVINQEFNLVFWLMLSIPYLWSISGYINMKNEGIKGDNKFNSFLAFLVSPLWYLFRPMGFFIYFKRLIMSKLKGGQVQYRKTER
mgnify:FL=1